MENSKQPAFPGADKDELCENYVGKQLQPKIGVGLTKIEYFAAQIMPAVIIAEQNTSIDFIKKSLDVQHYEPEKHYSIYLSKICVEHAYYLLKELDISQKQNQMVNHVEEENKVYMCTICGKNPVDVHGGFDTCENCVNNI